MSEHSAIEWTDATWNPVRGCTKISPGCAHCYAETFAERFRGVPGHPYEQGFDLRLVPEKLAEPVRWKTPKMIFVDSMSDLFHKDVPNKYISAVFGAMAACPQHTFQVLTKRAERLPQWFYWASHVIGDLGHFQCDPLAGAVIEASRHGVSNNRVGIGWPLENVWLGVSVENQQTADDRIPHLLRTPAAVRFLSVEPLLGPVDLRRYMPRRDDDNAAFLTAAGHDPIHWGMRSPSNPGIDWVIVGGESGPGARPMHPDWARSVRDQCVVAGVPFFFKQHGEWSPHYDFDAREHLQMHQDGRTKKGLFPDSSAGWEVLNRVGKKAAGRLLDGRTWDQMPVPAGER